MPSARSKFTLLLAAVFAVLLTGLVVQTAVARKTEPLPLPEDVFLGCRTDVKAGTYYCWHEIRWAGSCFLGLDDTQHLALVPAPCSR